MRDTERAALEETAWQMANLIYYDQGAEGAKRCLSKCQQCTISNKNKGEFLDRLINECLILRISGVITNETDIDEYRNG